MTIHLIKAAPIALLVLPLFASSCASESTRPSQAAAHGLFDSLEAGWSADSYWYEGTAEINFYQASIDRYGQPRRTDQVVHILITEDHLPGQLVKADDWRQEGLLKVLKFNLLRTVPAGVYEYREMMSAFFNLEDHHLFKMTYSSQEWCGNTFKEIVNFKGLNRFDFNTYWEGQGNGSFEVSYPRHLILYDSLPVQLRMLRMEIGLKARLDLLPSQFSSKAVRPELLEATVEIQEGGEIEVPAGAFPSLLMALRSTQGEDRFWFEEAFPHRLVRWLTASGDSFQLRASKRLPYWELNRIGDEAHLPEPAGPLN